MPDVSPPPADGHPSRRPGDAVREDTPEESTATVVARIERESVWMVLIAHEHGSPEQLDYALRHLRLIWGDPPPEGAS